MIRIRVAAAIVACTLLGNPDALAGPRESPAPDAATAVRDLLDQGVQLLQEGEPKRAHRAFEMADHLSDGKSDEALFGLARADLSLERFDEAIESARTLLARNTIADLRAPTLQLLGVALLAREVHRPVKLPSRRKLAALTESAPVSEDLLAAEEALRSAIDVSAGKLNAARYYLAEVLMHQRRDDLALEVLRAYVDEGVDPGAEHVVDRLRSWLECVESLGPLDPKRRDVEITYPTLLSKIQPEYPKAARAARVMGTPVLSAIVDTDGNVPCMFPWRHAPSILTDAAMEAVRQWKYSPGLVDGKPVSVYFLVVVEFILK